MRQDTRSAWADSTLTSPAPKRRSRTFNVVLGCCSPSLQQALPMLSSCGRVLVYDTRLGAALLGCLGALVLSHVWASRRALATVWWSCGLVLLCVVGMAVYAWVRAGLSPVDPVVVETLAPILPVAACTAVGTGYVWRLCARLVADHRSL